jgi:hypothetical protein
VLRCVRTEPDGSQLRSDSVARANCRVNVSALLWTHQNHGPPLAFGPSVAIGPLPPAAVPRQGQDERPSRGGLDPFPWSGFDGPRRTAPKPRQNTAPMQHRFVLDWACPQNLDQRTSDARVDRQLRIKSRPCRPAVGRVGTSPISSARPTDQAVDVPGCPSTSKHLRRSRQEHPGPWLHR